MVSEGEVCGLTEALPTCTEVALEGEVGELYIFCRNLLNFLSTVTVFYQMQHSPIFASNLPYVSLPLSSVYPIVRHRNY